MPTPLKRRLIWLGAILISATLIVNAYFPLLPVQWLVTDRFDNLKKIEQIAGPVVIAHGTADQLIPYAHGQRLFAAAGKPRRFFPVQGMGHNDPLPPEFFASLRQFLNAYAPL
jgi:fermentation-respiration switch protein FrsA (DUF1100 family)